MSKELQPPVLIVSLVKIELPTVIKNEPPKSEIVEIGIDDILGSSESEEEIIPDIKDIDIVYHPVCEEAIKSEILESYYCESVKTQVLVNAENSPFIQADNITQRNKTGDTNNENVSKGTGQAVVEVQGSSKYSNVLGNLESDKQLVIYLSRDLNGFSTKNRKGKQREKTNFAKCYKIVETTSWAKDKEKIKVIKAPVIPVKPDEYTSLAKDKHVCNQCQHACDKLTNLKCHIKRIHREVTTMYQCPYCPYKSKWKHYIIKEHIIQKHKDTKDIQWFQCKLCEKKFKLKYKLTQHMKVHLKHKQMKDGLDLHEKRYHCNNCDYKTDEHRKLKRHNLVHLKPEEIEYFYCYHCSYKCKQKSNLKIHIFRQHFKNVKQGKRHDCDKCDYKTYTSSRLKKHKLVHLKPEEIQYLYCYHCSNKFKRKEHLRTHIFRYRFKNAKQGKRHHCDKCNYKTYHTTHLKNHKLTHLKPEEIQYLYCYHCFYKAKLKGHLKEHIFRHFKNEEIRFHCYICDFVTQKRDLIIEHIRKHFKNRNKYDETISKY